MKKNSVITPYQRSKSDGSDQALTNAQQQAWEEPGRPYVVPVSEITLEHEVLYGEWLAVHRIENGAVYLASGHVITRPHAEGSLNQYGRLWCVRDRPVHANGKEPKSLREMLIERMQSRWLNGPDEDTEPDDVHDADAALATFRQYLVRPETRKRAERNVVDLLHRFEGTHPDSHGGHSLESVEEVAPFFVDAVLQTVDEDIARDEKQ